MSRKLRIHVPNSFYHATLRGNHRQNLFRVESDRKLLNAIVARAIDLYDSRIHAYCWMTNHLHFLIQVGDAPLGSLMRQIASSYARAFQMKLETTGHLFERRYHARMVAADAYLLAVLRYVHLNPVQAGLVSCADHYPWSSHLAYNGGRAEPWLTTDFALSMFSTSLTAARAGYRRFMADGDPDWSPQADGPAAVPPPPITRGNVWHQPTQAAQSVEQLLAEACARFGIHAADLRSASRDRSVVLARGWIGQEALVRKVATLSEISRLLGRDRSTLRHAMRLLKDEPARELFQAESGI